MAIPNPSAPSMGGLGGALGAAMPGPAAAPSPVAGPGALPTDPMATQGEVDGTPASPEEQDLYDKFVAGGMLMLYDERFVSQFRETLKSGEPTNAVGEAVAQTAGRVAAKAADEGVDLPGDVVMHGSLELTEQAGELAERLGVSIPEEQLEVAYYRALERLKPILDNEGLNTPEDEQEGMSQLEAMKADGRMEQVLAMIEEAQAKTGGGQAALEKAI